MQKKIVLIANNPSVTKPLFEFLREMGYKVVLCEDPKESIQIVGDVLMPDLILCDSNLPVISGMELAKLYKGHPRFRSIPFLLITAKVPTIEEIERADLKIAADDFVKFPIDQSSFYGIISKWLESDTRPASIAERVMSALDSPSPKQVSPPPVQPKAQKAAPAASAPPVKQVRSWRKGSINLASATRLIFNLLRNNETGSLKIMGNRRRMRATIQNGNVVDVQSNYIREDTLGRFLIRLGKITPKENEGSLKRAKKDGVPQGRILKSMNVVTEKELRQFVTQQKTMKFLRLFHGSWSEAAFEFVPRKVEAEKGAMTPVPLAKLLKMGVMNIASGKEIYETFNKNEKLDPPIYFQEDPEKFLSLVEFEPESADLARNVDGRSIRYFTKADPDNFDKILKIAYMAIVSRAARFEKPKEAVKAKAPRRAEKTTVAAAPASRFSSWDAGAYHERMVIARTMIEDSFYQEAIPELEKALAINPESSEAMALKAWARFELKGRQNLATATECKDLLKKSLEMDQANDLAFFYLGKIFQTEGKQTLADAHFNRAFQINPTLRDKK